MASQGIAQRSVAAARNCRPSTLVQDDRGAEGMDMGWQIVAAEGAELGGPEAGDIAWPFAEDGDGGTKAGEFENVLRRDLRESRRS